MPVSEKIEVIATIGLEVHAQLATRSKMFCACPTTFAAEPNSATCPVCLGFPGTLPVLNGEAVNLAVRLGLAVGSEIARRSTFARKNYFYPDLPKGYQITQYDRPLCRGGAVEIDVDGGVKRVPLVRIHLEEDAGKSLHETPFDDVPEDVTLVEWNRSGVPLAEIVSEPELDSPAEAMAYLTELRRLLRALGVSEANMEEGNLRCDANVSVRRSAAEPLGTRVEIKNVNSIRNVGRAIAHEIERQAQALGAGEPVRQETRLFDAASGRTRAMRSKEEAEDYRYFPEPDLGALEVSEESIAAIRAALPELPRARRERFVRDYGVTPAEADLLNAAQPLADYFEETAAIVPPASAARWVTGETLRWMKEGGLSPERADRFHVRPRALAELVAMVEAGDVSVTAGKAALEEMVRSGRSAAEVVEEKKLRRVSDEGALRAAVEGILAASPGQVALYRSGKTATLGWFVGQVMKATGGSADPAVVQKLLRDLLQA